MKYKKKIIGITGHRGLIGNFFQKKYKNYKFDKFKGDIENLKDIKKWIKNTKCEEIIHLAAKVPTHYVKKNYKKSFNVNYKGTINLVKEIILQKKNIKWFFFASTSHVYKFSNKKLKEDDPLRPSSKYGKTKYLAEEFLNRLKNKGLKICIGRIFSLTHPKQNTSYAIPAIYKKIKSSKNKDIILNNLNHERDFCHIEDVCKGINLLLKKRSEGAYNIGSGKKVNLKDIARYFAKNKKIFFFDIGKKTSIIADNKKIKKIGFKIKHNLKRILSDF